MDAKSRSKIVVNSADVETPAVSVIVPCYNDEKYIPDCLDSLLAQTFSNWEAICINDGSTDGSLSVLKKYAKRDRRIKVIDQENKGTSIARNNAIKAACGKYIFPLDADDKIAETCLEELYNTITTTDYALVCTDCILFQRELGKWVLPHPTKWNMYNWHNGIHNSAMYEKKYWKQFDGYSEELNRIGTEDFDFALNFLDAGLRSRCFFTESRTKRVHETKTPARRTI
ncbi:MAG: glycosyltransferase [Puniceicoccales bacterium]|jgi:glycosyltransferase involved in cell wall biosynthesis|nr:glycosyltransferase [Puniceicoccales bacterium]